MSNSEVFKSARQMVPYVYKGKLDCSIKIERSNAKPICCKQSTITVGRNRERHLIMHIAFNDYRKSRKASYVLLECRIHAKYTDKGIGSIEVKNESVVVFLMNCAPNRLKLFLTALEAKLLSCNQTSTRMLVRNTDEGNVSDNTKTVTTNVMPACAQKKIVQSNSPGLSSAETLQRSMLNLDCADTSASRQETGTTNPLLNDPLKGLSVEQRRVLNIVLKRKQNIFFTGSAGTGKSMLLKKIIGLLPADSTVITAATGAAACQIGGTTLHSFAGIGDGRGSITSCVQRVQEKKGIVPQWKKCRLLIIDEISMVDPYFFEMAEAVARRIRGNDKPFGGIQLIVTGDFLQLPPVTERGKEVKFCFQSRAWAKCITETVLLRKVYRQNEDHRFMKLLNQLRLGKCDDAAERAIRETQKNIVNDRKGIIATKLCTHSKDAESVNKRNLVELKGILHCFIAKDQSVIPDVLSKVVPKELKFKTGAQVMLTKNLNLAYGLSNGSRGVIRTFNEEGYPVVTFADDRSPKNGVEIKPYGFAVRNGSEGFAIRRQLPLKLAWAISIHKSQGMTLDAVEVCLNRVFAEGQAYVALSRAKSLKSLRVIGFEAMYVNANEAAVQYYAQLEEREQGKR